MEADIPSPIAASHRAVAPLPDVQPEAVAIVDTNVLLDVFSCHDLMKTFEGMKEVQAGSEGHGPKVT
jgi:hypothetical protein